MRKILSLFILALCLVFVGQAWALPVGADYTYTGTPGNYVLDFTLTNYIPEEYNLSLYFFGVDLPFDSRQESPSAWSSWGSGSPWNNSSYGGSSRSYLSTWITGISNQVLSGDSLSGFKVYSSSVPSDIHFYTYAYHDGNGVGYYESDAFNQGKNPGFEGLVGGGVDEADDVGGTSTPEPASMALLGIGLAGLARRLRKRN